MGLAPLDVAQWLQVDDRYGGDVAEKARLCAQRHGEVFAALPFALEASVELAELIDAHLSEHFPALPRPALPEGLHPLDAAGRVVQEDLCLMVHHDGQLVLGAASVCFPSRWRMTDKLGLPTAAIHNPVPHYAEQLEESTDTVLARLRTQRPVWRSNWSLYDDPTLFRPTGGGRTDANRTITSANAGERLWVRVERQTLRRLARTGAIVFTIRIHLHRLDELTAEREALAKLAYALRSMPADMAAYKSLPAFQAPLLEWLDRHTTSA